MTIKVGDRLPEGQLQEFIDVETAGWSAPCAKCGAWLRIPAWSLTRKRTPAQSSACANLTTEEIDFLSTSPAPRPVAEPVGTG